MLTAGDSEKLTFGIEEYLRNPKEALTKRSAGICGVGLAIPAAQY